MTTLSFFTAFILKLVRALTLSRVFVWAFTALTFISFYTVYENRSKVLALLAAPSPSNTVGLTFKVGQVTQRQLQEVVTAEPTIIGVTVFSTDLRLNQARALYFFGDDQTLTPVVTRAISTGSDRVPLFTGNDQSNLHTIRLINGQFACIPFDQSLFGKLYPELNDTVKTICRTSIPSYYGYFSGYIEAYLTEVPSPERELQFKLFIEKLANEIYFRDVLETQHPERAPSERRFGG